MYVYVYIKQIFKMWAVAEVYLNVHCITISTFGRFESVLSRELRKGRNS